MLDHRTETSNEWDMMATLMVDRLQETTRRHARQQMLIENLQDFLHNMSPDQRRQAIAVGRVTVSENGDVYFGQPMPQPATDGELCLKWVWEFDKDSKTWVEICVRWGDPAPKPSPEPGPSPEPKPSNGSPAPG